MAIAGRYVWLFTALCIAFLVIFFWSLSARVCTQPVHR